MNQQTVINKFIEKTGGLDPKHDLHYVQGSIKGRVGITTEIAETIQIWRNRFYKDNQQYPFIKVSTPSQILPSVRLEYKGFSWEWDEKDLLNSMRILQSSPFSKISVIHSSEPIPMAFTRKDCIISVLLAPLQLELPKPDIEGAKSQVQHFKGNPWRDGKPQYFWTQQMPDCTFWLVEFPTHQGSFSAELYGYPIGRMLKCRKCSNESTIQDWINRKISMNHPECMCSCNTYDDFCGCNRNRERAKSDRLWKQMRQARRYQQNAS